MGKDFSLLTIDFNPRKEGDMTVNLFRNFWAELAHTFSS